MGYVQTFGRVVGKLNQFKMTIHYQLNQDGRGLGMPVGDASSIEGMRGSCDLRMRGGGAGMTHGVLLWSGRIRGLARSLVRIGGTRGYFLAPPW